MNLELIEVYRVLYSWNTFVCVCVWGGIKQTFCWVFVQMKRLQLLLSSWRIISRNHKGSQRLFYQQHLITFLLLTVLILVFLHNQMYFSKQSRAMLNLVRLWFVQESWGGWGSTPMCNICFHFCIEAWGGGGGKLQFTSFRSRKESKVRTSFYTCVQVRLPGLDWTFTEVRAGSHCERSWKLCDCSPSWEHAFPTLCSARGTSHRENVAETVPVTVAT